MEYLISLVLITFSALFSGLTLGYFTLNQHDLRRQAKLGNKNAQIIYPIRKRGNQLLTTLLLGNVIVNTTLAVFLGSLTDGVVATIIATFLIVIFGEILPQAIIARHALRFGATAAPFVRFVMFIMTPLAYPIALLLDRLLGHETPTTYSKHEIMQIVSEHEDSEESPIDEDEERIIHGALQFSHRSAKEVMTRIEDITSFDENQKLTHEFFEIITDEGYSRYPVYSGTPTNIIGILFAKDLLTEDDHISIKDTKEALETNYLTVRQNELLDIVLSKMLKQKRHIAIVHNKAKQCVGLITLEDIIEEIIQVEIEDEDDAEDNAT